MLFHANQGLSFNPPQPNRRDFLVGASAAAGGLLIGIGMKSAPVSAASQPTSNPLAGYVHITPDNNVTVLSSQFDKGQGSYHGVATLVVEELEADWSQVDVVGASGNTKLYGNIMWGGGIQGTGGSTSMASSYDRYRVAGATARQMLVNAAAKKWNVNAAEVSVQAGVLRHSSGQSATFGEVAPSAAELDVPNGVALKEPANWTQIGNADVRRFDSAPKTDGTHPFTIDIKLPNMLTAVVAHPPKFGAVVASFDGTAALKVRGVKDVVQIPQGVAVVAEHMWAAIKGRAALLVDWDESNAEQRGTKDILAEYRNALKSAPRAVARQDGDTDVALSTASKVVEATYEFPFLAHAAMEPLNAVVRKNADGTVEVWGGHQLPDLNQFAAAKIAGVSADKVKMHVMKAGGSFGRRAVPDADVVAEATSVAKAINFRAPVKVQWTREDDMAGGRYRPAYVHKLRAGIDAEGNLTAWDSHIVGQSILKGTAFEEMLVKDGIDGTSVEGVNNLPYAIPNISVGLTTTDVRVPVLWWRAVGSTHTAYAVECFVDEVAKAMGKDPYQLRLQLLSKHPRHSRTLKMAAEKAGWETPLPKGRHRGIAVHESFNSVVAHVVELSMEDDEPKIHKVTIAVDCGIAVNPDVVKAQMEGGTGFGLGAILAEEVSLDGGVVQETNYDGYTPLRIDKMPPIEVHIVPTDERPTGVGEPGVPTIGPALANAVAAAKGEPVRILPFSKSIGS